MSQTVFVLPPASCSTEAIKAFKIPADLAPDRLSKISASRLEALYEKLNERQSVLCKETIARGLGNYKQSEVLKMAGPLFDQIRESQSAFSALVSEQTLRRKYHGSTKPIKSRY